MFPCLLVMSALAAELPVHERGHAANPSWSPDGRWLAFELDDFQGSTALYLAEVANGTPVGSPQQVRIPGSSSSFSSGAARTTTPTWHPRGIVIFEGSASAKATRLYQQTPQGAAAGQLLTSSQIEGSLSWPATPPDGMQIAFISDSTGRGDIYVWERSTNQVSARVTSPDPESAPAYNQDGTALAFSRKSHGRLHLFTWSAGDETPRVGGNGDQTQPAWAGDAIVFFSNERGTNHWDIVVSEDVGKKRTIARDVRYTSRARPAISPDGQWVAYSVDSGDHAGSILFTTTDGAKTVVFKTGLTACGDPALVSVGDRMFLAYTALPSAGADWRQLHIAEVTGLLP